MPSYRVRSYGHKIGDQIDNQIANQIGWNLLEDSSRFWKSPRLGRNRSARKLLATRVLKPGIQGQYSIYIGKYGGIFGFLQKGYWIYTATIGKVTLHLGYKEKPYALIEQQAINNQSTHLYPRSLVRLLEYPCIVSLYFIGCAHSTSTFPDQIPHSACNFNNIYYLIYLYILQIYSVFSIIIEYYQNLVALSLRQRTRNNKDVKL